jgi:hypothetical protein
MPEKPGNADFLYNFSYKNAENRVSSEDLY